MKNKRLIGFGRLATSALVVAGAASVSAGLVTLDLTTDNFGGETTFEMVSAPGGTVFPPNESVPDPLSGATAYEFTWNLSQGGYQFTIFDSFGDGICCNFGVGGYSLTTPTQTIPSPSGGAFGDSETIAFSIEGQDVPLPASGALVGLGMVCLAWARRRFQRA